MDAGERARALDHAASCSRCDARLREERALTLGLRALAVKDEGRGASGAVESALLAAFRDSSRPAPVAAPSPAWRRSSWTLAAAAALLLACGLLAYRAMQREPRGPDNLTMAPPSVAPPLSVAPAAVTSQTASGPGARTERRPRAVRRETPAPRPPFIRDEMTLYGEGAEVATDFMPLAYSERPTPMESGQLIRVQMPRSALANFGLPVNIERADTTVKADLLVGEDGLARAIRFVR